MRKIALKSAICGVLTLFGAPVFWGSLATVVGWKERFCALKRQANPPARVVFAPLDWPDFARIFRAFAQDDALLFEALEAVHAAPVAGIGVAPNAESDLALGHVNVFDFDFCPGVCCWHRGGAVRGAAKAFGFEWAQVLAVCVSST